jgi:hypothetical protein
VSDVVLDVGWHNPEEGCGEFVIALIKNCDWENPLLETRVKTLPDLRRELQNAARRADEIERKSRSCQSSE